MRAHDYAAQSAYSDPGRHIGLLADLPTGPTELSAVARNLIVHYRSEGLDLPDDHRGEVHARWVSALLDHDQARHPVPLTTPRAERDRVLGCCRDHSLFVVSTLRAHQQPARIRAGFVDYFAPDFHHDHVVVETYDGTRWRRFDPELAAPTGTVTDPMDMVAGVGFHTAGEVWQAIRRGAVDPDRYGAVPGTPLTGAWFVQSYVVLDAAARFGHEMLLWDGFGAMASPDGVTDAEAELTDQLAEMLAAADADQSGPSGPADRALFELFAEDDRVRPGDHVRRMSPYGEPPVTEQVGPRR